MMLSPARKVKHLKLNGRTPGPIHEGPSSHDFYIVFLYLISRKYLERAEFIKSLRSSNRIKPQVVEYQHLGREYELALRTQRARSFSLWPPRPPVQKRFGSCAAVPDHRQG